jgi:hypothetical protein
MATTETHAQKRRRRWLGAISLVIAVLMLIAGETVLKGRFSPWLFIAYWALCFCLTVLAIAVALLDFRSLSARTRADHKALLEETLRGIEPPRQEGRPPTRKNRSA